jgi:hypothetical protein
MENVGAEYPYRPKWTAITACVALFGIGTVVLGIRARNNHQGPIIRHSIRLSPGDATTFYWVLFGICVCFVLLAILLAVRRLKFNQHIMLTESGLIVPVSGWSRQEMEIPYRDITGPSVQPFRQERSPVVTSTGGAATISGGLLPSESDFDEIHERLALLTSKNEAA